MTLDLRSFRSPEAAADAICARILLRLEAKGHGQKFLLGCPGGRSAMPVYAALAKEAAQRRSDLSDVIIVMMDEYLLENPDGTLSLPNAEEHFSCYGFAQRNILDVINADLPSERRILRENIWLPDPDDPGAYDQRITSAGGIDYFILASGSGDGHVAFNPPGSGSDSVTRIVCLAEQTRRDNLETFPAFSSLKDVPTHGVTVGIQTIAAQTKEAGMILCGLEKTKAFRHISQAIKYDPDWPATVLALCRDRALYADYLASEAQADIRIRPMVTDSSPAQNSVSIGIDIGGSKMLGCLFDSSSGALIQKIKKETAGLEGELILEQAVTLGSELYQRCDSRLQTLGVAIPELVRQDRTPASAWNFDWRHLDIELAFREMLRDAGCQGYKFWLESDVRAAAFAEYQSLAAQTGAPFLYVTLSTGIAHTLVIDGRPYAGARGYAIHFSGTDIVARCDSCNAVVRHNLELHASGKSLGERYSEATGKVRSAKDLFDDYQHSNTARFLANDALHSASSYLGQLVNILDPATLVIGGGIGMREDVFERLDPIIRSFIWSDDVKNIPIQQARLGDLSAAAGAVMLANAPEYPPFSERADRAS